MPVLVNPDNVREMVEGFMNVCRAAMPEVTGDSAKDDDADYGAFGEMVVALGTTASIIATQMMASEKVSGNMPAVLNAMQVKLTELAVRGKVFPLDVFLYACADCNGAGAVPVDGMIADTGEKEVTAACSACAGTGKRRVKSSILTGPAS